MSNVIQWIARGVLKLGSNGRIVDADDHADFEQVDGRQLDICEFRSSAAMRLEQSLVLPVDFSDTLPACSFRRAEPSLRQAG